MDAEMRLNSINSSLEASLEMSMASFMAIIDRLEVNIGSNFNRINSSLLHEINLLREYVNPIDSRISNLDNDVRSHDAEISHLSSRVGDNSNQIWQVIDSLNRLSSSESSIHQTNGETTNPIALFTTISIYTPFLFIHLH